ncbi:tartrate dehydrogenase [Microbacterium sp. Bi121]|uniref:tartrate dehydrogenase n=1 Tax=Microbacterium sp. Bi121 TaxID=2822348 RepID=UPI001E034263|nr:tartrate dehydrogenase [Microbacterium sp. Bi121]CAH0123210.1 D-malate dehydrogenase [decarboxylating] [Microbacterium sp. Bi121]
MTADSTGEERTYRIATLPGDGIGNEVVPAAIDVLDALGGLHGIRFDWRVRDWGCDYFLRTGRMMPEDALEQMAADDAIFLGAVGAPGVPDHESLWGMLIPIRREFDQYVNLRPARLLAGVPTPLAGISPADMDMAVIRENVEGEYSRIGGRLYAGTPHELVVQESVFTRRGIERVMNYAFELAARRRGDVTSATKSNGIVYTMPFWDEIFAERAAAHPQATTQQYHIDALVAMFVLDPKRFDVVVASNLFGDILTDLGAAVAGSIGIAPSANINPEREHPSMFEPVHGSAPDIAGQGIANPVGQIWSGAMMLEHLGEADAAARLMRAVEDTLGAGIKTRDLGGTANTAEVASAVIERLRATH